MPNPLTVRTRDLIERDGISPKDLAKRSGVDRRTVWSWTHEHRAPRIDMLEAVLNVLGYELTIRRKEPSDG
jgi:transcriptional regulator with XRE-family HTH domain